MLSLGSRLIPFRVVSIFRRGLVLQAKRAHKICPPCKKWQKIYQVYPVPFTHFGLELPKRLTGKLQTQIRCHRMWSLSRPQPFANNLAFVWFGLNVAFNLFQSYRDCVWMWQGAQCSLLECCLTEISRPRHFDMIFHPVTLYWHWADQF